MPYCIWCFISPDFIISSIVCDLYFLSTIGYVVVRPLSTVGYTSVVASIIHSRQWSN